MDTRTRLMHSAEIAEAEHHLKCKRDTLCIENSNVSQLILWPVRSWRKTRSPDFGTHFRSTHIIPPVKFSSAHNATFADCH